MRRIGISAGSLAVPVAAAALLAGCGSSSNSPGTGSNVGTNAIARAAYVSNAASGYRFTITLQEGAPSLGGQVSGTGSGSFGVASRSGQLALKLSVPALGANGRLALHEVIAGQNVYLQLPSLIASRIPGGRPWIRMNLSKLAGVSGLSSLTGAGGSSNPAQFLQYLRAASTGGVKNLGSATVDGISTTHYHGAITLSKVAGLVPAAQRQAAAQGIASLQKLTKLTTLPVDVYVDGKNLVRRLALSYKATVAAQTVSTAVRLDFIAYGPQPAPAIPPAGQVTDLTRLLGSLGSLG